MPCRPPLRRSARCKRILGNLMIAQLSSFSTASAISGSNEPPSKPSAFGTQSDIFREMVLLFGDSKFQVMTIVVSPVCPSVSKEHICADDVFLPAGDFLAGVDTVLRMHAMGENQCRPFGGVNRSDRCGAGMKQRTSTFITI